MDFLTIILIVLVCVAIWAVAEMAMMIRKARASIDEITHSATEAIDQATPVITKLDGVVDDLQPALREVTPLVVKASDAMDEANVSLERLNGILGDVGSATRGVAGVGESASRIVNTATSAAVGVVSKVASFGGISIPEGRELIEKGSSKKADETANLKAASSEPAAEQPERKTTYVSYAPVTSDSEE